jgi:hypothetical protein
MPFRNERASGEALLTLEASAAMRDFQAMIRPAEGPDVKPLPPLAVPRNGWQPKRVIAIDGSTVTTPLRFGLPSADASLLKVSIVLIDLQRLNSVHPGGIPSPALFRDMESVETIDKPLPGSNVLDRTGVNKTPAEFFRESVYRILSHRIDPSGESLGDTLAALMEGHDISRTKCPVEDCDRQLHRGVGEYRCTCPKRERLFESDALRFVERFNPAGSNGEAHGEVRHLIEVLSLLNILRFFANEERVMHLREVVFVLDGPLAMFGHAAWLAPAIRGELKRINGLCKKRGFDLALFGFEKSGQFVEHFENLDFCETHGPRRKLPSHTVLAPDASYINARITFRPPDAKVHGKDTYFGRKILYKTKANDHAVITMAMVNDASQDFDRTDLSCYPRLGDCLNVLDELSTYLYHDGFVPLIRAHSQAAIPLVRGADILRKIFTEEGAAPKVSEGPAAVLTANRASFG